MLRLTRALSASALALCISMPAWGFTTTFGVDLTPLDPAGWSIGDTNTTHQAWDKKENATGNTPDVSYNTAGATLTDPTLDVIPPGFKSGSDNFYSFSGDFGAEAYVYNHTGSFGPTYGTHVIVQIASGLNGGVHVIDDTLEITLHDGTALTGGAHADILAEGQYVNESGLPSPIGPVDYAADAYEFFLPGYTGDFKVSWGQRVHATQDFLQIDTAILENPAALTIPEPGSLALLGLGTLVMLVRRRAA